MKAVICGANGAMGKLIAERLGDQVVGKVSADGENGVPKSFEELGKVEADVVIDFSHHTAAPAVVAYAEAIGAAAVIGTTGHTAEEKAVVVKAAENVPVFFSGNMCLGMAVLRKITKEALRFFPDADVEIVEIHHNRKVDAPSGTAEMIFESIQEVRPNAVKHCGRAGEGKRTPDEIGIASLRMGNVVGTHEVHICTPNQTITLTHQAHNRAMFADGAVEAAKFMVGKPKGLYDMKDLLGG